MTPENTGTGKRCLSCRRDAYRRKAGPTKPRTRCKHGHDITGDNGVLRRIKGKVARRCIVCERNIQRRRLGIDLPMDAPPVPVAEVLARAVETFRRNSVTRVTDRTERLWEAYNKETKRRARSCKYGHPYNKGNIHLFRSKNGNINVACRVCCAERVRMHRRRGMPDIFSVIQPRPIHHPKEQERARIEAAMQRQRLAAMCRA